MRLKPSIHFYPFNLNDGAAIYSTLKIPCEFLKTGAAKHDASTAFSSKPVLRGLKKL
jgi:hypothetical protein